MCGSQFQLILLFSNQKFLFFSFPPHSSDAYLIVHEFSEIIASSPESSLTDSLKTNICMSSQPDNLDIEFFKIFPYLVFCINNCIVRSSLFLVIYLFMVLGKLILELVHSFTVITHFTSHIIGSTISLELLSNDVMHVLKYIFISLYISSGWQVGGWFAF